MLSRPFPVLAVGRGLRRAAKAWHTALSFWAPREAGRQVTLGAVMQLEVLADDDAVARRGAAWVAAEARAAVAARGRFVVAFSGGHTPWHMLRALAGEDVPWA